MDRKPVINRFLNGYSIKVERISFLNFGIALRAIYVNSFRVSSMSKTI